MTVEMEQPFVWPAEPKGEDLQPWNNKTFHKAREENEEYQSRRGRLADAMFSERDRADLRRQAEKLLKGEEKWTPGSEQR